jgi:hypothetical protein
LERLGPLPLGHQATGPRIEFWATLPTGGRSPWPHEGMALGAPSFTNTPARGFPIGWSRSQRGQMRCVISRLSAFSRLQPLQTRAPQQHNRTVLAFAEFKAKAAEVAGLTCRVVILVLAFGPATTGPCVATVVVPLASPLDEARRALILSGNIISQPSMPGRPATQQHTRAGGRRWRWEPLAACSASGSPIG